MFKLIEKNEVVLIHLTLNDLFLKKQHHKVLAEKNALGQTLLHVAVELGYLSVVEELLSWDLKIFETDITGKTPLDIAENKALMDKNNVNAQMILSLLKAKAKWQERFDGFKFHQLLRMIKITANNLEESIGLDKVFFIGSTGAGKSTLLNYLCGTKYVFDVDEEGDQIVKKVVGSEKAKVSDSMISETLYPKVIKLDHLPFVYCDLAGLFDNRSLEERICAVKSQYIMSKPPGKIKHVLVCLDINGFANGRGVNFKKVAVILTNLVRKNESLLDNISFVITKIKPGKNITQDSIIAKYINKLYDYYVDLNNQIELTEEDNALLFMLGEIKKRKSQIVIPNIGDDGESKNEIVSILNSSHSLDSKLFNFIDPYEDHAFKIFDNFMLEAVEFFYSCKANQNASAQSNDFNDFGISMSANRAMFEAVYTVTKILDFDSEIFSKFRADFEPYKLAANGDEKTASVASMVNKLNITISDSSDKKNATATSTAKSSPPVPRI